MIEFCRHAQQRAAQRNLSLDEVEYVMGHGQRFHRAGALIFFLRRRDLPEWDRGSDRWERLAGTAVVLDREGRTVITAWRNRRSGLKRIRRKPAHDRPRRGWPGADWLA